MIWIRTSKLQLYGSTRILCVHLPIFVHIYILYIYDMIYINIYNIQISVAKHGIYFVHCLILFIYIYSDPRGLNFLLFFNFVIIIFFIFRIRTRIMSVSATIMHIYIYIQQQLRSLGLKQHFGFWTRVSAKASSAE